MWSKKSFGEIKTKSGRFLLTIGLHFSRLPISDSGLPGLAAVYQLKDLDSFIANTAVPPPPVTAAAAAAPAEQSPHNAKASSADEESQVGGGDERPKKQN